MTENDTSAIHEKLGFVSGQLTHLVKAFADSNKSSEDGRRRLYERQDETNKALNKIASATENLANRVERVETRLDQVEPVAKSYEAFAQRGKVWLVIIGAAWVIVSSIIVAVITALLKDFIGI